MTVEAVSGTLLVLKKRCNLKCSACSFNKCFGCYASYLYNGSKSNPWLSNCGGCPNAICEIPLVCSKNCGSCILLHPAQSAVLYFTFATTSALHSMPNAQNANLQKSSECKPDLNPKSGFGSPENCSSCDFNNCQTCKDSHILKNSSCLSENKFKECIDGLRIIGEFCCAVECQAVISMDLSMDGYLLDSGICFQCLETCYSCVDGKCIFTKIGYPDSCQIVNLLLNA